ncbi:MAG TPA: hypothetical protein VK186_05265 [Candidatus Deferrimicrobium sp.]|nr:hypothetical protein [Candidatus Deferrimicrobium sp.]
MRKIILLLAVLSIMVVMNSCQRAEEVTVTKYFQAMEHNDRDTMSTMANEPKRIEFKSYEILSIDQPVTKELELPKLLKKAEDMEKTKKEQGIKFLEKSEALQDAQDQLDEGGRRGDLVNTIERLKAEVAVETQKVKDLQQDINKIKKAIEREKALITLSTAMTENLEMFTGESAQVKVTTRVKLQNNDVKNYIFLLRKDTLKLEGKVQNGRWIIIKLMDEDEYQKSLTQKEY